VSVDGSWLFEILPRTADHAHAHVNDQVNVNVSNAGLNSFVKTKHWFLRAFRG
jgi:hypothetical protein